MRDVTKRRWRIHSHSTKGWFVPDDAAEGGGDADRPARVGANGKRTDTGEDSSCAAAAAAARSAFGVPGVAGDTTQRGIRDRLLTEFGCRRFAEEYRTVGQQPCGGRRVLVPRLVRVDRKRAQQPRPAAGQQRVFQGYRHPVEESLGFAI